MAAPDKSNKIVSYIRTYVPMWIGIGLAWLAKETGIVVDEETSAALALGLAGLLQTVYYGVARALEGRFPWIGWFLGTPAQPSYDSGPGGVPGAAPLVVHGPPDEAPEWETSVDLPIQTFQVGSQVMVSLADAKRMAEAVAQNAYEQIEIGGSE